VEVLIKDVNFKGIKDTYVYFLGQEHDDYRWDRRI